MKKIISIITGICIIFILMPIFCIQNAKILPVDFNETNKISKSLPEFEVPVYMHKSKTDIKMNLNEYLYGVLCGEMPANYEPEALKAQVVAAFTYMLYRKDVFPINEKHPNSWVCTDSSHCKAYLSKEDCKNKWGQYWYDKYYNVIQDAVDSVYLIYMSYDDKPINAVFHAISSGNTEDAADVWGSKVPYLITKDSSNDMTAEKFLSQKEFSSEAFFDIIKNSEKDVNLLKDPSEWLGEEIRSQAGGVISHEIGGQVFTGREIRSLFELRSSNYEISYNNNVFTFITKGYGHGVGMSQNGANELAKEGYSFDEILSHYYSGIEFKVYSN